MSDVITKIDELCDKKTSIYGYAKMENVKKFLNNTFPDFVKEYPYAVSIGINIPDEAIDSIDIKEVEKKYLNVYKNTNNKLDRVSKKIETLIKNNGYRARSIPASDIISKDELIGDVSHKLIANLAGLGWIGKSRLLINPYYGPRIRWATILTNLPVPYAKKELPNRCNTCRLCVVNCPSGAIKNVEFKEEDTRDTYYNPHACNEYLKELEKQGRSGLCGLCVKVCPWGLVNKNSRNKVKNQ